MSALVALDRATGADLPVLGRTELPDAPSMTELCAGVYDGIDVPAQCAGARACAVCCASCVVVGFVCSIFVSAVISANCAVSCGVTGVRTKIEFLAAFAYMPVLGLISAPILGGRMIYCYYYLV